MKWFGIALLLLSISSGDAWSQIAGIVEQEIARAIADALGETN